MKIFFKELFGILGLLTHAFYVLAVELPVLVILAITALKDMFKDDEPAKPITKQ